MERYAACACAEVEDAEVEERDGGGGEEEGGEVGGYVFGLWSGVCGWLVIGSGGSRDVGR